MKKIHEVKTGNVSENYRFLVNALLIGSFFLRIAIFTQGPMVGFYVRYISDNIFLVSAFVVGLLATGAYISEIIFAPVIGVMSDYRGKELFLVIGPLIGIFTALLYPLSTSLLFISILLTLEGIGAAAQTPVIYGLISEITDSSEKSRIKVTTSYIIVSMIGVFLGILISGFLWDIYFTNAFRIISFFYLLSAIAYYFVKRVIDGSNWVYENNRFSIKQYWKIVSNYKVLGFGISWILINSIAGLWISQVPFQMTGKVKDLNQSLVGAFSGKDLSLILFIALIFLLLGTYVQAHCTGSKDFGHKGRFIYGDFSPRCLDYTPTICRYCWRRKARLCSLSLFLFLMISFSLPK